MKSTLFLQNITAIDHAYIDRVTNSPIGGSVNLSVNVSGEVEDVEQVVVDFSKIKHTIKDIIDDHEEGFDHKLWVADANPKINFETDKSGNSKLITPSFSMFAPSNAFKIIKGENTSVGANMKEELEEKLRRIYPKVNISVSLTLHEEMFIPREFRRSVYYFRYVHGLKNSSSWGCQNITHGHLSWLGVLDKNGQPISFDDNKNLQIVLDRQLQNTIFVWDENVFSVEDDIVSVGYETDRGYFNCVYNKLVNNVKIIDTETTVENLAAWFIKEYQLVLKSIGASKIYISEGLTKGCVIETDY